MGEALGDLKRTCYCGDVGPERIGQEVTLMGWVNRRRDLGGLVFIDLRDRAGIIQVVFNPEFSPQAHEKASALRNEYVIAVKGKVSERPKGTENPELKTGQLEVRVNELFILSESNPPPFPIDEDGEVAENLRLRYRYLDLRRPKMQRNLILRHRAAGCVRDYLHSQGFLEIETPFLTKSTPEGARDYLVPSRVNPGQFYALPQSPQLFKQLLMISGFDRYFQIVKCFRDEDLRADRQPEFTQIDIEMSFIDREDIYRTMEGMMKVLFRETLGLELATPFPRLSYEESISRYGVDNPDVRFGLEMSDVSGALRNTEFKVFAETLQRGGMVKALKVQGDLSRKELDDLNEFARGLGGKGLAWVRVGPEGWPAITRADRQIFFGRRAFGPAREFATRPRGYPFIHGRFSQDGQRRDGPPAAPSGQAPGPDPRRSLPFRLDHGLSPPGVRRSGRPVHGQAPPVYIAPGRGFAPPIHEPGKSPGQSL